MYNHIQQGDQYTIPFRLYFSGKEIVDANPNNNQIVVQAIKIQIEHIVKRWTNGSGELTYSSGLWLFPITEEESRQLPEHCRWQFGIKKEKTYNVQPITEEYHYSKVGNLDVWQSLIKNWNETNPTRSSLEQTSDISHNHQLEGEGS